MVSRPRLSAAVMSALLSGPAGAGLSPWWTTWSSGALVGAALLACQDESQPEYWVDKLQDEAWRPRAVKRLEQFFEDASARANQDRNAPEVKTLLDKIVAPLSVTYASHYDQLDDKTRSRLVKLLATLRDPRTEPALLKALAQFGETGMGAEDVRWAALAAADMKLESAADPMLAAFKKLRDSQPEGREMSRDFNKAMVQMASPRWGEAMIAALAPEMERPPPGDENKSRMSDYQNQFFWQTTAAQVLGELGEKTAVDALLKVALDPAKAPLHTTSVVALVRVGAPAAARAGELLLGKAADLQSFADGREKKAAGAGGGVGKANAQRVAAVVLGAIGSDKSRGPMLEAIAQSNDPNVRAVVALELPKVPVSAATLGAFKQVFQGLPSGFETTGGMVARPLLAEAASSFFDRSLVPWLVEQAERAKKEPDTVSQLLIAALKLATEDQLPLVQKAVGKLGQELEKDTLASVVTALSTCKSDVQCYLTEVAKPANQQPDTQFVGIKAAYQVGVLGNAAVRDALVERLPKVEQAAVRFVAVSAIDHLSPAGGAAVADALQKQIDENARKADREKMAGDAPVRQVVYRLRSRS